MARGQRKPIEEKIKEKEEVIAALRVRVSAEERELAELKKEKRNREVESITQMLEDAGLSLEEAKDILQEHALQAQSKTA